MPWISLWFSCVAGMEWDLLYGCKGFVHGSSKVRTHGSYGVQLFRLKGETRLCNPWIFWDHKAAKCRTRRRVFHHPDMRKNLRPSSIPWLDSGDVQGLATPAWVPDPMSGMSGMIGMGRCKVCLCVKSFVASWAGHLCASGWVIIGDQRSNLSFFGT